MEPERPLRDVFADLAGHDEAGQGPADAQSFLADHGLPNDLLVTAIGSYAGTAPAEVAEHLAPFVAAGGVGTAATGLDAAQGLHLLASVPAGEWHGEVSLTGEASGPDLTHQTDAGQAHTGDLGHSGDLSHFGDLGSADSLDQVDHHETSGHPVNPVDDDGAHLGNDHGDAGGFSDGDTSGEPGHPGTVELDDQHTPLGDHAPADQADQHIPVDGPHLIFDDLPDEQPDHHSPDLTTEHHLDDPAHDGHDAHDLGDLGHFGG